MRLKTVKMYGKNGEVLIVNESGVETFKRAGYYASAEELKVALEADEKAKALREKEAAEKAEELAAKAEIEKAAKEKAKAEKAAAKAEKEAEEQAAKAAAAGK